MTDISGLDRETTIEAISAGAAIAGLLLSLYLGAASRGSADADAGYEPGSRGGRLLLFALFGAAVGSLAIWLGFVVLTPRGGALGNAIEAGIRESGALDSNFIEPVNQAAEANIQAPPDDGGNETAWVDPVSNGSVPGNESASLPPPAPTLAAIIRPGVIGKAWRVLAEEIGTDPGRSTAGFWQSSVEGCEVRVEYDAQGYVHRVTSRWVEACLKRWQDVLTPLRGLDPARPIAIGKFLDGSERRATAGFSGCFDASCSQSGQPYFEIGIPLREGAESSLYRAMAVVRTRLAGRDDQRAFKEFGQQLGNRRTRLRSMSRRCEWKVWNLARERLAAVLLDEIELTRSDNLETCDGVG